MAEEQREAPRTLVLVGTIVSAVSGLLTAILAILKESGNLPQQLQLLPTWQWLLLALLFGAISWALIANGRRRQSVLLEPSALSLDRANPRHLVGRSDDIERLARRCREDTLLFLEGESGAGKSALVEAGLVRLLNEGAQRGLVPVYVEAIVGPDWDENPRRAVIAALRAAFPPINGTNEVRSRRGPNQSIRTWVQLLHEATGSLPLLVIDQFDDYQTRHRDRFLVASTWLQPEQLIEQNGFWREIAELLRSEALRLLIVTRTDTAAGLDSVRFGESRTYRLDRVESEFVISILDRLIEESGRPVIRNPENGWLQLRERLRIDLEQHGTFLPQRLKIVIAGLRTLPRQILTPRAYDRAGGANGLETRFIETRVSSAARLHGVHEGNIRAALSALVDANTRRKTVALPESRLFALLGTAPAEARAVLEGLEQEKILRRRAGFEEDELLWQLDHDYLAGAVEAAADNANRWQRRLEEGELAVKRAGSDWRRRWRAYLPMIIQVRMLWDRLRGRFKYGRHASYARASSIRATPAVLAMLLIAGAAWYAFKASEQNQASAMILQFDETEGITRRELEALIRLQGSNWNVRSRALQTFLTTDYVRKFKANQEPILYAITGISPDDRDKAAATILETVASDPTDARVQAAAITAMLRLHRADQLPVPWLIKLLQAKPAVNQSEIWGALASRSPESFDDNARRSLSAIRVRQILKAARGGQIDYDETYRSLPFTLYISPNDEKIFLKLITSNNKFSVSISDLVNIYSHLALSDQTKQTVRSRVSAYFEDKEAVYSFNGAIYVFNSEKIDSSEFLDSDIRRAISKDIIENYRKGPIDTSFRIGRDDAFLPWEIRGLVDPSWPEIATDYATLTHEQTEILKNYFSVFASHGVNVGWSGLSRFSSLPKGARYGDPDSTAIIAAFLAAAGSSGSEVFGPDLLQFFGGLVPHLNITPMDRARIAEAVTAMARRQGLNLGAFLRALDQLDDALDFDARQSLEIEQRYLENLRKRMDDWRRDNQPVRDFALPRIRSYAHRDFFVDACQRIALFSSSAGADVPVASCLANAWAGAEKGAQARAMLRALQLPYLSSSDEAYILKRLADTLGIAWDGQNRWKLLDQIAEQQKGCTNNCIDLRQPPPYDRQAMLDELKRAPPEQGDLDDSVVSNAAMYDSGAE